MNCKLHVVCLLCWITFFEISSSRTGKVYSRLSYATKFWRSKKRPRRRRNFTKTRFIGTRENYSEGTTSWSGKWKKISAPCSKKCKRKRKNSSMTCNRGLAKRNKNSMLLSKKVRPLKDGCQSKANEIACFVLKVSMKWKFTLVFYDFNCKNS